MTKTQKPQMVTETCYRCNGSGFYAIGTCFGCGGAGTNTYTAAYVARRASAAKGRETARKSREKAAQDATSARRMGMTVADLETEVRNSFTVEDGDMISVWEDFEAGTTKYITVTQMAQSMKDGSF